MRKISGSSSRASCVMAEASARSSWASGAASAARSPGLVAFGILDGLDRVAARALQEIERRVHRRCGAARSRRSSGAGRSPARAGRRELLEPPALASPRESGEWRGVWYGRSLAAGSRNSRSFRTSFGDGNPGEVRVSLSGAAASFGLASPVTLSGRRSFWSRSFDETDSPPFEPSVGCSKRTATTLARVVALGAAARRLLGS